MLIKMDGANVAGDSQRTYTNESSAWSSTSHQVSADAKVIIFAFTAASNFTFSKNSVSIKDDAFIGIGGGTTSLYILVCEDVKAGDTFAYNGVSMFGVAVGN